MVVCFSGTLRVRNVATSKRRQKSAGGKNSPARLCTPSKKLTPRKPGLKNRPRKPGLKIRDKIIFAGRPDNGVFPLTNRSDRVDVNTTMPYRVRPTNKGTTAVRDTFRIETIQSCTAKPCRAYCKSFTLDGGDTFACKADQCGRTDKLAPIVTLDEVATKLGVCREKLSFNYNSEIEYQPRPGQTIRFGTEDIPWLKEWLDNTSDLKDIEQGMAIAASMSVDPDELLRRGHAEIAKNLGRNQWGKGYATGTWLAPDGKGYGVPYGPSALPLTSMEVPRCTRFQAGYCIAHAVTPGTNQDGFSCAAEGCGRPVPAGKKVEPQTAIDDMANRIVDTAEIERKLKCLGLGPDKLIRYLRKKLDLTEDL